MPRYLIAALLFVTFVGACSAPSLEAPVLGAVSTMSHPPGYWPMPSGY